MADIKAPKAKSLVDKMIGKNIRKHRQYKNMSCKGLGNAVNISMQQMQKYEAAVNRISAARLYEVSNVLAVPVQLFFEGLDIHDPTVDGTTTARKNRYIELMAVFSRINGACNQEKVFEYARLIAEDEARKK